MAKELRPPEDTSSPHTACLLFFGVWGGVTMKMVAEYLEKAQQFERFAASETDPRRKAGLQAQATAYRKLAEKRAKDHGLPFPTKSTSQ